MIPINQYFKTGTGEDLVLGRIADAEERTKTRFAAMQDQINSIQIDPKIVADLQALQKAFTDAGIVADQRMSSVVSDQSQLADRVASAESSVQGISEAVNRITSTISSAGRQIEELSESQKIDSQQILNRFLAVTDLSQRLEDLERGAEGFRQELAVAINTIASDMASTNRVFDALSTASERIIDRLSNSSHRMDGLEQTIEALEKRLEMAEQRTWWSMFVDWLRHLWRRR